MVQRNRDVSSAADAVDRALLNLTKIAPTTVAGAAALLIYFAELELEGVGWWQMHEDDRCYSHHLARHVAHGLRGLAA